MVFWTLPVSRALRKSCLIASLFMYSAHCAPWVAPQGPKWPDTDYSCGIATEKAQMAATPVTAKLCGVAGSGAGQAGEVVTAIAQENLTAPAALVRDQIERLRVDLQDAEGLAADAAVFEAEV